MVGAVSTLLKTNADAGTVHDGLTPETVLRGLAGLLYLNPGEDWREQTAALTDLPWVLHGQETLKVSVGPVCSIAQRFDTGTEKFGSPR